MDLVTTVVGVGLALGAAAFANRFAPFHPLPASRPKLAFFPKYRFAFADTDAFETRLSEAGFTWSEKANAYLRGSHAGDFSAKLVKLKVDVDPSSRTARIASPAVGVFFDTGDIWSEAKKLAGDGDPSSHAR